MTEQQLLALWRRMSRRYDLRTTGHGRFGQRIERKVRSWLRRHGGPATLADVKAAASREHWRRLQAAARGETV